MMIVPHIHEPVPCPLCGDDIEIEYFWRSQRWGAFHGRYKPCGWKCKWQGGVWSHHPTREELEAAIPLGPMPPPSAGAMAHVNEIIDGLLLTKRNEVTRLRRDLERAMERLEKLEG